MEELRTSRRPAKRSSYGDVLGKPPKYSANSDDYAEIFGGIATSSCSIPFLDLPPVSDGSDGGFVDYSEIFGGFHGGDSSVDNEELFSTERKKEVGSSPSSNGRTSIEVKFIQQDEEVAHLPQVDANKDYEVYPVTNTLSSSSNHSDDVSKQFNMSFHRTNHGSTDDAMSGKTHTTQLHGIPGYSYVVDTFSSIQDVRSDNFPNIQTNHPIQSASNGQVNHFDDTKSSEAALSTNQKESSTKFTSPENAPLNMKCHSRSSSNYSSSSGEISNHDITYVSVSDINLRTQPCRVPPPSRAPPKFVSRQEYSKTRVYEEGNFLKPKLDHQIHYRVGDAKSHGLQGVAKDTSSAAAAMKEAMEQAQARLKSAKELMERKRDNLQSCKKLGHKEGTKYGERKEVKAFEEDKIFDDGFFEKPLIKEDRSKKGYALDDMNGYKSSQLPYKSEEVSREWKMDTQFYELVNNDSKLKVIKVAFKQEDVERKTKTTFSIEDNKSYPEQAEKLHMDKETFESDDDNLKAGNMTCKAEISEMPNTNQGNVNNLEEAYSSHLENRTEKLQSDHEAQNPISVEEAPVHREGEKNEESSNNAFKVEEIYHDDEEACQFDDGEKKLSGPSVTSMSYEIEKKPEIFLRKDMQDEAQNDVNFTSTKCELEAEEEVVAVECQLEENECKLEETALASKHEESANLDGAQGDCMEVEDELKSKVALDGNVVKENTEELKPPLGTIEKEIKSANENPDCNEIETSEAQPEFQQNKKKQNADETSTELESTAKLRDLEGDNIESEDGKLKQGDKVENSIPDVQNTEKMVNETIERDRKHEKEQARKAEEREREREREKDRLAVERATREAHEQALNEARERAERIAVERVTAEARQRALAEAREKAERASAEALEKALAEKALKEAKLRAERAAVERATAEARERAVEKALAEKAAADARQRAERFSAISRDKGRKENEFRAGDKEDREVKLNVISSDVLRDVRFQNGGDVDSPLRCKARLERHQRTVERAAKALAEKNMRDILAQREQAERNRLAESLDADVRRWATGKEGNLRALLSTLQYILGPESGWQPVPLTDVITAAAAKKAYRKATLCVHPDKLQQRGASIQQKYICEKVFDLLKDAWNRFNSEER